MKNHWAIITVWVAVYIVAQLVYQSPDHTYFLVQASWSLALLILLLTNSSSPASLAVAAVELCIVFLNLFALLNFSDGGGFFYAYYGAILNFFNTIGFSILLLGAPWNGIHAGFLNLRDYIYGRFSGGYRLIQGYISSLGEKS